MRGADDNVVTLHGAAAASPPQPPLPRTRARSLNRGREGGLGISAGRAAGRALAAGTRVPYARLRCAPRRLRMPAALARTPAQCSPCRTEQGRRAPREDAAERGAGPGRAGRDREGAVRARAVGRSRAMGAARAAVAAATASPAPGARTCSCCRWQA
ncbi:hypothetical protein NN561_009232 [Cricetulus griseus]